MGDTNNNQAQGGVQTPPSATDQPVTTPPVADEPAGTPAPMEGDTPAPVAETPTPMGGTQEPAPMGGDVTEEKPADQPAA